MAAQGTVLAATAIPTCGLSFGQVRCCTLHRFVFRLCRRYPEFRAAEFCVTSHHSDGTVRPISAADLDVTRPSAVPDYETVSI